MKKEVLFVLFLLSTVIYSATADALTRSGYSTYKNITFTTPSGAPQWLQEMPYNVKNGTILGVNFSGLTLARTDKNASKEIVCTTAGNVTIPKQILQNQTGSGTDTWAVMATVINATTTGVNATCYYNYAGANEEDTEMRYYSLDFEKYNIGDAPSELECDDLIGNACSATSTIAGDSGKSSTGGDKYFLLTATAAGGRCVALNGTQRFSALTNPYTLTAETNLSANSYGSSVVAKKTASSPLSYLVSDANQQGFAGYFAYYTGSGYQSLVPGARMTWHNYTIVFDDTTNNAVQYGINESTFNRTTTWHNGIMNNITLCSDGWSGGITGFDNLAVWRGRIMNSTHKANVVIGAEFTSSDTTPPSIIVQSPTNTSYTTSSVWFNITLNEAGSWVGYSLDGASNITMVNSSGNWNAQNTSMSQGSHSVRFYANDTSGNMNSSGIIYFTVDTISPSLISFAPSAGTVGIDTNTTINLSFSENMDQSTFSGVTMKDSNNINVPLTLQSFSNTTYTAIFKPSGILGSNKAYTVTLTGLKDLAGNLLPNKSWSFTTATSYSINLSKSGANGWNLISLPVVPANTNIASVLSNVITDIENVWTYNSVTGNWSMYAPNSPNSSDLSTMTAGYGYWINYNNSVSKAINGSGNLIIEGASAPPQRTLISGWNLIGHYQRENTTSIASKCALFTLTPNINDETAKWWSMVFGYDNQNKQLTQVGYTANMSPGQGYWAFMTSRLSTYLYGPGLSAGECVY